MNIEQIISNLNSVNENKAVLCLIPDSDTSSRIYVLGQVKKNVPGASLGNREPELREMNVGSLVKGLRTFSSRFKDNDFLLESTYIINEKSYEFRYYQLTGIKIKSKAKKKGSVTIEKHSV